MVRIAAILYRTPVIKFRKGGFTHSGGSPSSAATATPGPSGGAPAAAAAPVQSQQTVTMSTISDIDLPLRYRRAPLSQEEIDHINGGGISDPSQATAQNCQRFVLNLPRKIVVQCNKDNEKKFMAKSQGQKNLNDM